MSKHTPGPLHVAACDKHTVSDDFGCVKIRDAHGADVPKTLANLTLWAAAPDLLDAMERIVTCSERDIPPRSAVMEIREIATAALAKTRSGR